MLCIYLAELMHASSLIQTGRVDVIQSSQSEFSVDFKLTNQMKGRLGAGAWRLSECDCACAVCPFNIVQSFVTFFHYFYCYRITGCVFKNHFLVSLYR